MEIISNLIYFNNNGTTVTDPEVSQTMDKFREEYRQQPSIQENSIRQAREQIAAMLRCSPDQLLFTKSTSDGINLGIKGAFGTLCKNGKHIITNVTEHPAILKACKELETFGAEITFLSVDREGRIDPTELLNALRPDTLLVSIMASNNETGVLQPIEAVAEICRQRNITFFSDGSQYVGKMRCDVKEQDFDFLAFSAHKVYGPKDVGVLYVKEPERFGHLKSTVDTTNPEMLASVVGMGKMAEISQRDHWENSAHISRLKNYFEHQVLDLEGIRINGSTRYRLYNTSNIQLPADKASKLKEKFVFAHNGHSHVLKAMGLNEGEIQNSCRFSFGKYNTLEEVRLLTEEIMKSSTSLSKHS